MKNRLAAAWVGLYLLMFLTVSTEAAVQVDKVRFARTVEVSEQQLHLQGAGLLRVMVFIKAYAGAFYLPETVAAEQALSPVAKRLELEYYHPITSEDFAKATRVKIADNVSADELEMLAVRIEHLAAMYRDVQPGDRYALTYVPGQGTQLALNEEVIGSIPGDDFARAVFSMWLGVDPIDESFKDRLLGGI